MNKSAIIALVGIVILVAGAVYFFTGPRTTDAPSDEAQQLTSMRELMALAIPQKCDFAEPESQTTGTIYIANGKVRGDFTSVTQTGSMSGHMITDNTTVHTWTDGMAQGVTLTLSASEQAAAEAPQGIDPDKKVDYRCSAWAPDQSVFELPSGVTFTDMSAMMPSAGAGAGASGDVQAGSAQCAACDMAPEPQRSQCRAALQCK